jgi:hypothetical protein
VVVNCCCCCKHAYLCCHTQLFPKTQKVVGFRVFSPRAASNEGKTPTISFELYAHRRTIPCSSAFGRLPSTHQPNFRSIHTLHAIHYLAVVLTRPTFVWPTLSCFFFRRHCCYRWPASPHHHIRWFITLQPPPPRSVRRRRRTTPRRGRRDHSNHRFKKRKSRATDVESPQTAAPLKATHSPDVLLYNRKGKGLVLIPSYRL